MVEAVQALPLEVDMPQAVVLEVEVDIPQAVVLEVEVDIPQVPEVSGPVLSHSQREQRVLLRAAKEVRIGHPLQILYNYKYKDVVRFMYNAHRRYNMFFLCL